LVKRAIIESPLDALSFIGKARDYHTSGDLDRWHHIVEINEIFCTRSLLGENPRMSSANFSGKV
jgi:hypothetical protein